MRKWIALLTWLAGFVALAFASLNSDASGWELITLSLGGFSFGIVGLLLAVRTHLITGWLFLALQISFAVELAVPNSSGTISLVLAAATLLTMPEGRLPSRRWVWAVWVLAVAGIMSLAFEVLELLPTQGWEWLVGLAFPSIVMIASAMRVFNDYRRSVGATRQQLKWFAWVLMLGGVIMLLSLLPLSFLAEAHNLAGVVLLVGSPIAIGLAVTRYRLYEIDRILSRTVTYTIVAGVLAGTVALFATVVGTRFDSPLLVAATTLGVAAAFNPLRKRVQQWVDRRFNRSKYDHERVVERFTTKLREDFDVDGLVDGWVSVVDETMQPRHIGVWTKTS